MATKKATTKSARKAPAKAKTAKVVTDAQTVTATAKAATIAPPKTVALVRRAQPYVLVTGGTGFLGSHLVRQLVEAGERRVRVLATSAPAWLEELGVETATGSVLNRADVGRALDDVGAVYHLAGRVSRDRDDAHQMYELHVEGTRLLCEAARERGVKAMVLASSSGTLAVTEDSGAVVNETWPAPLDIISRWPYYASKYYQERVALEQFSGAGRRLVIVNPSLLLGPGDERLSSTKVVLDFLARKIMAVPGGGLSFVDARDAAQALRAAMERGAHGEHYLVGAANWTFDKFFARLERLTKIAAPRFSLPSRFAVTGAQALHSLYRQWKLTPPVEPSEIEMAEYFWYVDSAKAQRELGFAPRDAADTLQETVTYVRQNFLGKCAFV